MRCRGHKYSYYNHIKAFFLTWTRCPVCLRLWPETPLLLKWCGKLLPLKRWAISEPFDPHLHLALKYFHSCFVRSLSQYFLWKQPFWKDHYPLSPKEARIACVFTGHVLAHGGWEGGWGGGRLLGGLVPVQSLELLPTGATNTTHGLPFMGRVRGHSSRS